MKIYVLKKNCLVFLILMVLLTWSLLAAEDLTQIYINDSNSGKTRNERIDENVKMINTLRDELIKQNLRLQKLEQQVEQLMLKSGQGEIKK